MTQARMIAERSASLHGPWTDRVTLHDDFGRVIYDSPPVLNNTLVPPAALNPETDLSLATRAGVHRTYDLHGRERVKRQVKTRLDGTTGSEVLLTEYTPTRFSTE